MRAREEQVASLAAAIYTGAAKMPHALKEAETYILEAERRAEQRVRAECREEISSLRNGLSKCASLTDGFASPECSISFLSEDVPEELRLYVNRIKSEKECDSERLDWIGTQDVVIGEYDGSKWKEVLLSRYQRTLPADLVDIRVTIDAAREVG